MPINETTVRLAVASELLKLEAKLLEFDHARFGDRVAIAAMRSARQAITDHEQLRHALKE